VNGAIAAGKPRAAISWSRLAAYVRREWALLASALVWVLLVLNFSALKLASGDEGVQYRFVQRLFGDAPDALGYYFGLGLAEAPFYGLGRLLDAVGAHSLHGNPIRPALVALGLGLLTLVAWPLMAAVLKGLRLRYAGPVLLASALGTPFFFYATFEPGKNHALDAVLFTVVVYLTFRYFSVQQPERWLPFALGVTLGFSYTVRYFSGAEAFALILVLAWCRRWRHAMEIAVTSAVVCLLLFAVPRALHVPVFGGGYRADSLLTFAPLNPLRMLFTDHRGLFIWSPVSALAAVGLGFLFLRRPELRRFLFAVAAMGVAIMTSYSLVAFWDGTWAFSQRFYTPLFPLVVIGLAGLVDVAPRAGFAAAAVAAAWSLFLAFNLVIIGGPQYLSTIPGGASDLALVPTRTHTSPGAYLWGMYHRSNLLR
jgi:hypothetical protein